jgi:uncharacterized protein YecE (DUF72 family)
MIYARCGAAPADVVYSGYVMKQIGLFASVPPRSPSHIDDHQHLADRLPEGLHLGPSSWTFEGWEGIVYPPGTRRPEIIDRGLSMVARHPLFRTVGIDRSHYAPLDEATLRRYGEQLPPGFRCVIKAWNALSTLFDTRTQAPVPGFLDTALCEETVIAPLARFFPEHTGPIVFQFAPIPRRYIPRPEAFAAQLDRFFGDLSTAFPYAVELRNRELLVPAYFDALARHDVAHVLNLWEHMPTVGEQLTMPGVFTAKHVVARLSLVPDNRYEEQKKRFMPFNRIAMVADEARDSVVALARAVRRQHKTLFVTVNNKVEGCSPLTVRALIERIVADVEGETSTAQDPR